MKHRCFCRTAAAATTAAALLTSAACRAAVPTDTGKKAAAGATTTAERWAFAPETDRFSPAAVLDLRSLNEKVAGEHGFIVATPDGDFARANDHQPIRFWAVDEYIQEKDDDAALAHKARWLAKRGVNMVRVHTQITPEKTEDPLTSVNQKAIDRVWRLVAAMKREGIYTVISPYWANIGAKGYTAAGGEFHGLLYFQPALQNAYKAWLKALYNTSVPQLGGTTLAKEPAVALIQLQNEDSLLFWTTGAMKGQMLSDLRGKFGAYLKAKYGSLDAANTAWGGVSPAPDAFQEKQGDEFAAGRAGLYILWLLTGDGAKAVAPGSYQDKRLADQLAFYTETMAGFNREMGRYLKTDLGCGQMVNAGNWRPADPKLLFDAERMSYLPNAVMGVNRYFTGVHDGKDNGWAIRPGDTFTNNSALFDPRGLPTNIKQVAGRPFIIPETEWVAPNAYQSEGPLLTAAYQSLTGVDISFFFADGDAPEWQVPFSPEPWNPPTGKWAIATPMQLGMFPAAALLFRQGYVKRGAPVVEEQRSAADVWGRKSPLIAEEGGWDPNRDAGNLPERSAVKTGVDPLAFLVGPVLATYNSDAARSRVSPDLPKFLDTAHQTVLSNTGELRLNYGKGIGIVNSPRAQAATGFLSAANGPLALGDMTITSGNEYATVAAVSLDGLPLKTSKKILVQVGTVARPTGWQDKEVTPSPDNPTHAKFAVVDTGKNPWSVVPADVEISVGNPGLTKAVVLDANGETVQTLPLQKAGAGRVSFRFPATGALYVVLN